MSLTISFKKTRTDKIANIILPVSEGAKLGTHGKALDKITGGLISYALAQSEKYKAATGDVLEVTAPSNSGLSRIFILGLGRADKLDALAAETAGGKLYPFLKKSSFTEAALLVDDDKAYKHIKTEDLAAHIAAGLKLRSYSFERYKSKKADKKKEAKFEKLEVVVDQAASAKTAYEKQDIVIEGTFMARDLVNTAPNELYPESYAKIIQNELRPLGIEVEIFDEKRMLKMGMGAIMAVGQGSERQPRMVIMRWNGKPGKKDVPIAFVGKGVTFDTGGISIKPGPGMDEMKMDMGGSAAVVGLMKVLAKRKAKINVVGIVGLAENMPSHNAYRPGDILTSYSGKTIEVLNTDAEGRLVLADCLTYMQQTYKPGTIIDLATLTGAIMVALGHEYCGTFATNDTLWKHLEKSSAATGEKLWRMPLDEVWKKQVESDVADIQNIGKDGRNAGACTAAAFLQHFIEDGTQWAHLDIAGTAFRKSDQPTVPKFGSGFGVRLLNTLVADHYEG
jgi:leucyl aminopeptidase